MFEKLKSLLMDELQIDESAITPDANLSTDLGINSIELADLVMLCEDTFKVEIKDEDIPTFYLDSLDHADRYDRKTVRLVGQAFADRSLPKGYYMFGRMAMTCCANDIQPIGWITQGIQKPSTKAYFRLTAQCKAVDAQGEKMLMLQEARAEIVPPPAEEYLNFNA